MNAASSAGDPRAPLGRGDKTALLVIDMLNDYGHADGDLLRRNVEPVVPVIAQLIEDARSDGVLVIYVNDNHGMWGSSREQLLTAVRENGRRELIDPVAPAEDAAFLFKARHSVFYSSALQYLLEHEGLGRLVLTGQVTEQCILYSALDAYIRHYQVVVPRDAVAHIDRGLADAALEMMERNMHAEITDSASVDLQ